VATRGDRSKAPRILAAALAICAIAGFAIWLVFESRTPREDRAAVSEAIATDSGGPAASQRGLAFDTILLPDGEVSASPASVRIGLGYVSEDEAAAFRASERGGDGAGPRDFAELATVARWLEPPAVRQVDGSVRVGPIALPAADRYVLQARADDGLRYYEAAFVSANAPAQVRARVAAGLRLRAPRAIARQASVLLRRVDGAHNAEWQALMRREAPQILKAYDETPLLLHTGADATIAADATSTDASRTLLPLPPGPLDVIALVGGVESERRRVMLSPGRILTLDLDPSAAELSAALATTLELRLIEAGSRAPVRDATVVWSSARGERSTRSDAAGRARLDAIDASRPLPIQIGFAHPNAPLPLVDGLPQWPERLPMTLDLRAEAARDGIIAKTLELQPLRWLIVETAGLDLPLRPRAGDPFPVFVLQRRERGTWRESPAEHFKPVREGLAVSLDRPGDVRVIALTAPWRLRTSAAVAIPELTGDTQFRTRLDSIEGRRVILRFVADGAPLRFAPVRVLSPLRGVPPATLTTNGVGEVALDDATVSNVIVETPGFEQAQVTIAAADATRAVPVALRRDRESITLY
jgi:hypothetical protein